MVNAVICEFNPFHNGHKYLLDTACEKTGADYTVCFMSGNFVQRGEPAVCDKHTRAAAAVKYGADLVFQIPTAHTLANATVFADAGVYMASAMGVPTSLCFGSEDEDLTPLFKLALVDKLTLAKHFESALSSGKSYASAVMDAYSKCCGENADILKSPNNLLAFEYIKAIIAQKSDIKVVNIKRQGTSHDSVMTSDGFASASYIRKNRGADISEYVPEPLPFALDELRLETTLMYSLYSKTAAELSQFADMSEGLENRFLSAAKSSKTYDELLEKVKSKRYTHSKLRRASMSVLLQNPKDLYKTKPPFMKLLAFNTKGRELLKTLNNTCSLPIITKPSDAALVKGATAHFELECRASDIYDFCRKIRTGGGNEHRISPIYVK